MTFSSVSSQEGEQRWNPTVWGLPAPSQARVLTTALREEAREGLEAPETDLGFPFVLNLLCDFVQVAQPLWASVTPTAKSWWYRG